MNEELEAMAVRALRRIDMWQELQVLELRRCCDALESLQAALALVIDRAQPPSGGTSGVPPTGE